MRVHHRAAAVAVDRAQVQVELGGGRQRAVELAAVQVDHAHVGGLQLGQDRAGRADGNAVAGPLADVPGGAQHEPLGGQPPRYDGHLLACLPDAHGGNVSDPHAKRETEFTFGRGRV